jgi:hypothetical protein
VSVRVEAMGEGKGRRYWERIERREKIDRGEVVSIHNTQCAVTRNPHTHIPTPTHCAISATHQLL